VTSQVSLDTICMPSEDVVSREIEGEIIIVPLVAGIGDVDDELYTLNDTGQAIWRRLDGSRTLREVVGELEGVFQVDRADLEDDVVGFASAMVERGILSTKA